MKTHTVIVGIGIASKAGRDLLSGVFSYIENGCAWRPKLVQSERELSAASLSAMEADGVDGYLLSFGNTGEPRDFLMRSSKPLVLIGTEREGFFGRTAPTAFVWNDNAAIGALGARHLASLGTFNSYGFVHSLTTQCSSARAGGFFEVLKRAKRGSMTEFHPSSATTSDERMAALADWLDAMPKPAAVMAAGDYIALRVLAAAERRGIKVPGQLMVVGVDNDELLVSHSSPPLTSIQPGHFEMGFKAAAELERLMASKCRSAGFHPSRSRRHMAAHVTTVPPQRIVERESTRSAPPAAMLVTRAKAFIKQNMGLGITASDVVAHLGCSRELADLRFREIEGRTVRATIEEFKLAEIRRLLKSTCRPVATIARQCGFKSASHLNHLFKRRNGVSPRDWRLEQTTNPPTSSELTRQLDSSKTST